MQIFGLLIVVGWLCMIGAWCTNLLELNDCDFAPPYKCEAIHAVGLIPPAALVTAWFGTDKS